MERHTGKVIGRGSGETHWEGDRKGNEETYGEGDRKG